MKKKESRTQYTVTPHLLSVHFGIPVPRPHDGYRGTMLERGLSLIDHEYIEKSIEPDGTTVWSYVTEPYGASGDELFEFIARCKVLGLAVSVTSGARHNDGCVRIEALKRETA